LEDIKPALKPSMQREPKVFLEDIYAACVKIEKFTYGLSFENFLDNELFA
jgi:uncharacterized protein with HEPN domain